MAIGITEFRELINALYEHPEWRAELRRLVLTDEILDLPKVVRELAESQRALAEAQRRTELKVEELAESLRELAEAQRRTDQRMDQLDQRMDRMEQRMDQLDQRMDQLDQRMDRMEQRMDQLDQRMDRMEQRMDNLGRAVGDLQRVFGSTVEEEAASVVEVVLRRKGYRVLRPAYSLPIDGQGEIDVVLPVEDFQGRRVWAVVEAKARLSRRDVQAWAQRMASPEWRRQLAERGCDGPYLVYAYSIRFDLGAQEMAESLGIGLLKSDGEVLSPREVA